MARVAAFWLHVEMPTNSAPERVDAMACVLTERACALSSANCTERRRIGSAIQQWTRSHFYDSVMGVPMNLKQLCARTGIVEALHSAIDQVDRPDQGGMMPRLSRWQLSHIRTSHTIHGDKPAWAGAPQAMTATTAARVIYAMQPEEKAHVLDMYTELAGGQIGPSTRRRVNKRVAECILAAWQRQQEAARHAVAAPRFDPQNLADFVIPEAGVAHVSAHRVIPMRVYRKRKRGCEITITSDENGSKAIVHQSTLSNEFEISMRMGDEEHVISSSPAKGSSDNKKPSPVVRCIHTVCNQEGVENPSSGGEATSGTCSVCLETPSAMLFLPCQHCCCCAECGSELTKCPLCRVPVEDSHKIYF